MNGGEAFVSALGYVLPERVVTNDDLAREHPDWDMERIGDKVGIRSRHVAAPHETSADLAYAAARQLLDHTGIGPAAVDALIFCTQTPDYLLPASACVLQHRLGLGTQVATFDVNQGCSGYVYGLAIAKGLISAGIARTVLFVTGETYSKLIHPRDRTVRVLFGDAGSATLVTATPGGARIGPFVLGTDGSGAPNLIVPAGGMRTPRRADTSSEYADAIGCTRTAEHLFMDGPSITAFAMERVPTVLHDLYAKAGITADAVAWYAFHQANAFMNERLRARLRIPTQKVPTYLERVGNTVSNTIPVLLRETAGRFAAGDPVAAVGFGVGYSWGATLLTWGDVTLA